MFKKLRTILTSTPSITVLGLVVAYLVLGFWVVPGVLKWQLEKQVAQRGHVLQVDAIRFNPLRLELEVDGLALTDGKGQAMAGFTRLAVDMQWRGIIDGAWTFADARLVSPRLRLALAPDGSSNFSALIAQFASEPAPDDSAAAKIPRLRAAVVAISDGQVEYFDQSLAQALVTHVTAMTLDLRGLSTLPNERTQYRLTVLTAEDESLDLQGVFGIDPLVAQGQLMVKQWQVATLARGLARQLELQAPAGQVALQAGFDLATDDQGRIVGTVQSVGLDLTDMSLQAPGADAPLLAAKALTLHDGVVDLARRDARFGRFALRDGAVSLALDAQGRGDWMRMVRAGEPDQPIAGTSPPAAPAPGPGPATPSVPAQNASPSLPVPAPWRVAVDDARIDELAIAFRDPAHQRSLALAAVRLVAAPSLQLADGGATVTLGPLQLQVADLQFRDGASAVSAPLLQTDAAQSTLQFAGARLQGRLDGLRLALAEGGSVRQGDNNASVGVSSLESSSLKLDGGQASPSLTAEKPRLQLSSVAASQAAQSARLDKLDLQGARLTMSAGDASQLQWDALALDLAGLHLADAAQNTQLALAGFTVASPSAALRQNDAGLSVQVQVPDLQLTDLSARQDQDTGSLVGLRLGAGVLDIALRGSAWDIGLTDLRADGQQLAAVRATEAMELAQLALGSTSLKLGLEGGTLRFAGKSARVALGGTRLRRGDNVVALKDAVLTVGNLSADRGLASGPAGAANARLQDAVLTFDALGLARGSGKDPFAQLAEARLSAGTLALALSDAPVDLRGDALAARLRGAALRDPAVDQGAPLLQLDEATLSGAVLRLNDRSLVADALVTQGARANLWLDAQGQLNLLELLNRLSGAEQASAKPASANATPVAAMPKHLPSAGQPQGAAAAPGWRMAVKQLDLNKATAQFEDRRLETPFAIGSDGIALQLRGLDTGAAEPMRVDLSATLRSGGSLAAKGTAQVNSGAADLQLAIDGVVLAPVQSYLAEYLDLTLTSGTVSTQGRLLLGSSAAAASRLSYVGGFSVDALQLQENAPQRPFLSWKAVRSTDLSLTLGPDKLNVGELQVDRLDGRLIIAQDQSINLTDVLKKREEPELPSTTADRSVDKSAAEASAPGASATFPVDIARVRVSEGVLDFADLSLRPQFGARMHQLKGVITGLSTNPERIAKVQLDARVDKFGSARIRGQASVLQPDRITEIDVAFRNLEMTSLSPYVVRFAGYEIASGKLSLDLQYKVRDSKLLGANKVVLNQMALGKKVETPGALDLPLDLALAVLKDGNGVIDIGLPVSGDLNDPQFDYGAVIAKAIGNVLGGIVTAPFRALAGLFGGGADKAIGTIEFEPGSAELAPPEQQKLEIVARALNARPQLLLKVAPVFAPRQDTPVLQSLAVRGEVARAMGLSLEPGEDPGPIDVADPRATQAIEAAFSARYAPAVLDLLKQRARPVGEAAVSPGSTAVSDPAQAPTPAQTRPAATPVAPRASVLPPAFHQTMLDRMISEQAVSAQELDALAKRRADGIVQRLTATDGVAPARVALAEVREITDATDKVVSLKLQLDVAK